jgi:hypothetical protein
MRNGKKSRCLVPLLFQAPAGRRTRFIDSNIFYLLRAARPGRRPGRRRLANPFFYDIIGPYPSKKGDTTMAKDKDKGKEKSNKPKLSVKDKKKKKKEKLERKSTGI